jgi:hypothetical protein
MMTAKEKKQSIAVLIASACSTAVSARALCPDPRARAMTEDIPPPMAPCDMLCIKTSNGRTSAIPVKASVPRRATNHISIRPVLDWAVMTRMLGHASRCVQSGDRVHVGHLRGRKDVSNVIGDELSALALECQKVAVDCDVVNGQAVHASDLLEGRAKTLDIIVLEECADAIVEPTEFFHVRFHLGIRLRRDDLDVFDRKRRRSDLNSGCHDNLH